MEERGGIASFEELALPLLDALYRYARWLTRDTAEAEDLVQEAYLKGLRGFGGFHAGSSIRAWMFRILRNTFLTSRTGLRAVPTVSIDDELPIATRRRRSCTCCNARTSIASARDRKFAARVSRGAADVGRGRDELQGNRGGVVDSGRDGDVAPDPGAAESAQGAARGAMMDRHWTAEEIEEVRGRRPPQRMRAMRECRRRERIDEAARARSDVDRRRAAAASRAVAEAARVGAVVDGCRGSAGDRSRSLGTRVAAAIVRQRSRSSPTCTSRCSRARIRST